MLCDYVWLCAGWLFELSIGCLFAFVFKFFYNVGFDQSFLDFMSKIQKHIIKKLKIKKFDRLC